MKCLPAAGSGRLANSRLASPAARPRPSRLPARAAAPPRAAQGGAGASGYAVNGNRPTSPKGWEIVSTALRKTNLKMISVEQLAQKRGTVIIDVRPGNDFSDGCIPGALGVPFFRLIEGWGAMQIARRATFAFFGILNGTEYNPDFVAEVQAAVPRKGSPVVLYCAIGGTLEPTGPSKFGRQSRSLNAAYELQQAGYSNVAVLEGGYNAWLKAEQPVSVAE